MKKIIFLIIFSLFILISIRVCYAVDFQLNLEYPSVGGAETPSSNSTLPNLINYIYKFALLACGITALVAIIIGAFQYVTSAGDSSKAGDAKDKITSALLGILILLTSVLILRTINPDLVSLSLTLPTTTVGGGGGTGGGYGYQDPSLKCYPDKCSNCYTCNSNCINGTNCTWTVKYHCMYCCGKNCVKKEELIGCAIPGPTLEKCQEAAEKKCVIPPGFFKLNKDFGDAMVVKCE
jgi:hypothetical protein